MGDEVVDVPLLNQMTGRGREIALAYYESGYAAGWTAGYEAAHADDATFWAQMRDQIRRVASTPPFDVLADRRGQHERAERQRQILRERGIA